MPKKFFSPLVLTILLSSCARGVVRTEPEPVPAETPLPEAPSTTGSSRTSWTITPSFQVHRYRSAVTAVIEQSDPSSGIRDSISTTSDFDLSLERQSKILSYNATIKSFVVQGSARTGSAATPGQFPISVKGRLEANRLSLDIDPDCSNQSSSVIPGIQKLVVLLPLQLRKDQTWTDSISGAVCSGLIPAILTTIRSYRVLGETESRGRQALRLSREDRTTSQGEGSDGQHRILLQSSGTGRGEILVDRTTGALLESSVASTVAVTITTSGRVRKFTQTSREIISEQSN